LIITVQSLLDPWQILSSKESLAYILPIAADSMGLSSIIFPVGFIKLFSARVTFRPFKVIQGHWLWYLSKARMRLPISPSQ